MIAFSRAIYSFCNPDDPVPPASQAFRHARFLASEGLANTLVDIVRQLFSAGYTKEQWDLSGAASAEALKTIKSLAANDDICQKLSQEGCVLTCLKLWRGYEDVSKAVVSASSLLRQLSQCDPIKHEIMEEGGADLLCRCGSAKFPIRSGHLPSITFARNGSYIFLYKREMEAFILILSNLRALELFILLIASHV